MIRKFQPRMPISGPGRLISSPRTPILHVSPEVRRIGVNAAVLPVRTRTLPKTCDFLPLRIFYLPKRPMTGFFAPSSEMRKVCRFNSPPGMKHRIVHPLLKTFRLRPTHAFYFRPDSTSSSSVFQAAPLTIPESLPLASMRWVWADHPTSRDRKSGRKDRRFPICHFWGISRCSRRGI